MRRAVPALALVLALLALAPRAADAGAWSIGLVEATVQRLLGARLTGATPADGDVLTYDAATMTAGWAAGGSGSGSGDLTAITETGDALIVTSGTGPVPNLSAHANVEGLADGTVPASIAFTGSVSATENVTGGQFVGGVTAITDLSIDFGDGAIQTNTQATDIAITLEANGLGAGRAVTLVITSTGGGNVTYPTAVATAGGWAGTAPTTIGAGQRLLVQLYSLTNDVSGVIACATVLGDGS